MTAGEAAHQKWWDLLIGPKAHLTWDRTPDKTKQCWEEIALAAIEHHQEMHGCCQ